MYFGHRVGRPIPRSAQPCLSGSTFARTAVNPLCALCRRANGDRELQQFSDTLTIIPIRRVTQGARRWRSVDRNSFRSPRGACDSGSVQPCLSGSTFVRTAVNPLCALCRRANGDRELQQFSDTLTIIPICRVAQGARFRQSVDRNLFRSPCGASYSQERSTLSVRFNLCENCCKSAMRLVPSG
jgi:hypothetical protein